MFYGFADEFVVKTVEPSLTSLLDRRLWLCWSTQNVVAQERNKRHCNTQRAQQRSGHHDGEALQELAGIAGEHQEWQIGDDIRDRCVENRGCEFGGAEPACNRA